ncbi:MAG: protein phosphatase 2C domain-containing protein [Cyanobacteria bacterium P01_G01_bin.54]
MARSPFSAHSYLWAIGPVAANLTPPHVIADRYQVRQLQIWQDLTPRQLPDFPEPLPAALLPYLKLYPHRFHLPELYGVCTVKDAAPETAHQETMVVLLHNAPLDAHGELLPSLESQWLDARPLRQVYWLWQLLELWSPLQAAGVTTSLLAADNLRVEGGRLRLIELLGDRQPHHTLTPLAKLWLSLARTAHYSIATTLENIGAMLQQDDPSPKVIRRALNQLLLEQAAQWPLTVQVASATDPGSDKLKNEDAIYPPPGTAPPDPRLLLVCDGIGGHAEGAIASQSAMQSLQLQGQALLKELHADPRRLEPELVAEQLTALVRITNNLIATRNDQQNRSARQRMATTTVMALQLPQVIETPENRGTSHELYLLHIGDSRAYWITEQYCQCLTVDHDVIRREVCKGEVLPLQARQRADAGALTQALGMRGADRLHPTIQRFVIEEEGILLLCSDGLSDRYLLERCWPDVVPEVLRGTMTLQVAVNYLVGLARQHNGHDNISIVAAHYSLRQPAALPARPHMDALPAELMPTPAQLDLSQVEAAEVPASEEMPTSIVGDSNGAHQPPLFLEAEPITPTITTPTPKMPTFTNLADVENLLLELNQPEEKGSAVTPDSSMPPTVEASESEAPAVGSVEIESEALDAATREAGSSIAEPAKIDEPGTVSSHPDGSAPSEPTSGDRPDTYTPSSELPEMVPTWDNPNPWAAATPPPYGPGSGGAAADAEKTDPSLPEPPASLFEEMANADFDSTLESRDRLPLWLWIVGIGVLVVLVSAVVLGLWSRFNPDRQPETPATEQQD